MTQDYVRYSADVETIPAGESEAIEQILASMHRLHGHNHEEHGQAVRVSHAKSHGVALGELTVLEHLPDALARGIFMPGARYPVIARLANVPGEIDSDAVATQRGFAFKLLDVAGDKLPDHQGQTTQDSVLDTENRFAAADASAFLVTHRMLEHAPQIPDALKSAVSPEGASPYRTVARLRLPKQEAFSPARQQFVDGLSFCVSHSLEAHRPLGSIMRARLRAYPEMSRLRRSANGVALTEPASVAEVPA